MIKDFFEDEEVPEKLNRAAKKIRQSDAYPALLGAIAGGIAGALIAALIAGMLAPRRGAGSDTPPEQATKKSNARAGWSPREILELVTIGAALAKQIRAWAAEREKK
ncbi:MAG: hypothetical protein HY070_05575 [Chloroflexi bacterium]|nr:hypothetical protein [Chloroflexota bacterium]